MNSIWSLKFEEDLWVLKEDLEVDLKDYIRPVTSSTTILLLYADLKLFAKMGDSTPESQKEELIFYFIIKEI